MGKGDYYCIFLLVGIAMGMVVGSILRQVVFSSFIGGVMGILVAQLRLWAGGNYE